MEPLPENNPDAEFVPCNLCGLNTYTVVYKGHLKEDEGAPDAKKVYKSSGAQRSEDTIVKCKNCDLVYVNPRLKSESIIEGYTEGEDATFVSQVTGREATFRQAIKFIERFSKPGKILDVGTAGDLLRLQLRPSGSHDRGCPRASNSGDRAATRDLLPLSPRLQLSR